MNTIRDPTSGRSWASPRELMDFIEATYHGYLRLILPMLSRLTDHIAAHQIVPPSVMDKLQRNFTALADLLETHLARQEGLVFPRIRQLREPVGETAWSSQLGDRLKELIDRERRESQDVLALLQRVRQTLADAACTNQSRAVAQLTDDLGELWDNLASHVHLETDVLFPAAFKEIQAHPLAV